MLLKLNFISKQTQSLSPSHCGWRQVKSSIPSKKKDWRENGHTRYMKNRCQESSFHSFGFAIIIVLAEVGSIWACLEKVLSHLSRSGLGFGGWAIWRGLELSTEGLISAWQQTPHCSATFASCAGCVSSWSRLGGIEPWVGFYFLMKPSGVLRWRYISPSFWDHSFNHSPQCLGWS